MPAVSTALRIGKVVAAHPSDYSIDVVMLDNGAKLANVPVCAMSASTRAGVVDLPQPDLPDAQQPWSVRLSHTQDALAVVGFTADGSPICLGFQYPQVNQLAMPDSTKNLRIHRHASDFYTVTDAQANHSLRHPGGAHLSIGTPITVEAGSDFDHKWAIAQNQTGAAITLHSPNASTLTLDAGAMTGVAQQSLALNAPTMTLDATTLTGTAQQGMTLNAASLTGTAQQSIQLTASRIDLN